jgi:hypothetical protein
MADPRHPDAIMMTASAAHLLGFHLDEVIPYGIYAQSQQAEPGIGTSLVGAGDPVRLQPRLLRQLEPGDRRR